MMQDYSKLVQALRHVGICQDCNECEAGRWHNEFDCCLFKDAADAIEALEKQIDSIENEKTNLEADIINLEIALDKANTQLPKRGEWELIDGAEPMRWGCSQCKYMSWETSSYCPRCGADMRKMEVQE